MFLLNSSRHEHLKEFCCYQFVFNQLFFLLMKVICNRRNVFNSQKYRFGYLCIYCYFSLFLFLCHPLSIPFSFSLSHTSIFTIIIFIDRTVPSNYSNLESRLLYLLSIISVYLPTMFMYTLFLTLLFSVLLYRDTLHSGHKVRALPYALCFSSLFFSFFYFYLL